MATSNIVPTSVTRIQHVTLDHILCRADSKQTSNAFCIHCLSLFTTSTAHRLSTTSLLCVRYYRLLHCNHRSMLSTQRGKCTFTPPPPPPPRKVQKASAHTTEQASEYTNEAPRNHRPHRCSRCGKIGHNVRRCPVPHVWYRQRCSLCGGTGHNARNCPKTTNCRVCHGATRLACCKCNGVGVEEAVLVEGGGRLSAEQTEMAERVRRRVKGVLSSAVENYVVGEGGARGKRCNRCMGRGYLSCMACSD